MLHFYKGSPLNQGRVGIFPGAFNPLTLAHLAVASAALAQHHLDQLVFLLPTEFPHKPYTGASFEDRIAMLEDAARGDSAFVIASSDCGLFIDIAREFRRVCGLRTALFLLCGKDAADRIVDWDYGTGVSFAEQLNEYGLLVASRGGEYNVPIPFQGRILSINLPASWDNCSSSMVREAVAQNANWRQWVPESVARRIAQKNLYK